MSLLSETHASPFQLQDCDKVGKIKDTTGEKLLELSKNKNQFGLFERMFITQLNKVLTPYLKTWRLKASPKGHLIFQLLVSVQDIQGKEFLQSHLMLPTPTVDCIEGGEQSARVEQSKSGSFKLRKLNKPHMIYGAKLSDAILYLEKLKVSDKSSLKNMKLTPEFCELMMGYPIGWTELKDLETQ